MAIYTATIDTEKNLLTVSCNEVVVENVQSVNFGLTNDWDGNVDSYALVYSQEKAGGVTKTVCLKSNEDENYDSAIKGAVAYFARG
jgi:hypothetical protein